MDILTTESPEGSFAAKWEEFVEENNLSHEVASKLQAVYYAGASAVFEELMENSPKQNTPHAVHASAMAYKALEGEVYAFFEDQSDDEDLTLLVVKDPHITSTGGIAEDGC